jgi:hypothetical protein
MTDTMTMAHQFTEVGRSHSGVTFIGGMSWFDVLHGETSRHCYRCGRMILDTEAGAPCLGMEEAPDAE